ncbi:hypothetical protein BFW86_04925 [Pseudomonas fluorescens]|nr:hypothetical protein BFW86_04925 [Pseudomonas fluorescens]
MPATVPINQSTHFTLIKEALPTWVTQSSPARLAALRSADKTLPNTFETASADALQDLKSAVGAQWTTQNAVDRQLKHLQDVEAFAEPLLKQALLEQYGLDENVRDTHLRLYAPIELPWGVSNITGGVSSRTMSLLHAALHNFAATEVFTCDSAFITRPDAQGLFDVKHIKHRITIGQFKTLVRDLDIGRRYRQHLEEQLGFKQPLAKAALRARVILHNKAAFQTAVHSARMLKQIDETTYDLMQSLSENREGLMLNGAPLHCHDLTMMDTPLTGIIVIAQDLAQSRQPSPVVVYVPDDPEHPLKRYPDGATFVKELTRQLRQPAYQRFFCRFVPHARRGLFLARLNERLGHVTWHDRHAQDPLPSWRETPLDKPYLHVSTRRVLTELWDHLYQRQLDKILNDASEIAVPTAYADRMARWAWWDNLEHILSDVFNAALLVATPFMPVLGQLMLAYSAWQIADEVFEGLLDLAQGRSLEAIEHAAGVAQSVVQLGIFGAGAPLGELAKVKTSAFIEGLKPVRLADGRQRLWHPDLTPYRRSDLAPVAGAKPDAEGFHHRQGQKVMRLDRHHYAVSQDPYTGRHRILHPKRPDAYQPEVFSNGAGTLVHEGETPMTWDSTRLMQRLTPATADLTPAELARMRDISGVGIDELRRVYVEGTALPPLLANTLARFELRRAVDGFGDQVRNGASTGEADDWSAQSLTELPGWPTDRAIEVFDTADLSGYAMKYGDREAGAAQTLKISRQAVQAGQLPEQVVEVLNDRELEGLLGAPLPAAPARTQALRNRLGDYLDTQKDAIFAHRYRLTQASNDATARLVQQACPQLPDTLVQRLLSRARPVERRMMAEQQRLPLRLKRLAEALQLEVQATHAYEGLYPDVPLGADTERLLLNAIRLYTDTFADLRISVHEHTPDGLLRCSVGPEDARTAKVLLRSANGRYALPEARTLTYDLYEATLRLLPEAHLKALGYKPGQGPALKQWLQTKLLPPAERRIALAQPPIAPVIARDTLRLLKWPDFKALRQLFGLERSVQARITRLYPTMTPDEARSVAVLLDTPQGLRTLDAFETEKHRLMQDLHNWLLTPTASANRALADQERLDRVNIGAILRHCWEQRPHDYRSEYGDPLFGRALDFSGYALRGALRDFPRLQADFGHVTSLTMTGAGMLDSDAVFLHNFPQLRTLDLTGNQLTELPGAVSQMPRLNGLKLGGNPLQWTEQSLAQLKQLQHLKILELSHNAHLSHAPDVSRMPLLQMLMLNNTGISRWPSGLFELPRPATFVLDLRNTAVRQLPPVEPGSWEAELVVRTRLDRQRLDFDSENLMVDLRRAAGLDPWRTYPARGEIDSAFWLENRRGARREHLQRLWDDLEAEQGSQGFFEVIRSLQVEDITFQTPEDAGRYQLNRTQLSLNVWRMLQAMHSDDGLRERLFIMAREPFNCADAGAEIFNAMGIEVLVFEAYRDASPGTLGPALARLARQKARLHQVNRIAQADVKHRLAPLDAGGLGLRLNTEVVEGQRGTVDEVEVYVAYQTGLKERLDLPWLSSHMAYRTTSGVSAEQLTTAGNTVLELEQGDGLVNQMLEQDFWNNYLMDTYPQAFRDNQCLHRDSTVGVDDLRSAQDDWAHYLRKPADQQDAVIAEQLRQQLTTLADKMGVPHSVVLTGEAMSDAIYLRIFGDTFYDESELGRRLTRNVLGQERQTSESQITVTFPA